MSDNIYVVTNEIYKNKIVEELLDIKQENIYVEPMNKETALWSTKVLQTNK
jgi:mannose-1-phosphate guanylyltransferase